MAMVWPPLLGWAAAFEFREAQLTAFVLSPPVDYSRRVYRRLCHDSMAIVWSPLSGRTAAFEADEAQLTAFISSHIVDHFAAWCEERLRMLRNNDRMSQIVTAECHR